MELALKVLPALLTGLQVTLKLFSLTLLISLPLGFIVGLGATTSFKPLRYLIATYTWVIRGTPLLLQMFFIFYGLPLISESLVFPRFTTALVAFVINYTAYYAEIFRGGILAIPKGQIEGAKVLGLGKWQTVTTIVLPQVFKKLLPSIGNEIITLVKDTSLIYAVGLSDVMKAGKVALQREINLIPLIEVAFFYLLLTGVLTLLLKHLENKLNYYE
ncbi:amino acid ABC transporter permease [Vagococcus salmoninarum]|uniref:Amino acid ABC transporter permease n=1 Tax=Vagococcus salmoninarum TaxID=2739 RepID=A0A429ZT89_9ENTE|nr:amino acid ABC transporter permease [Vagococcus salmoninarum]MBE9389805.1 amino acid ABC transporter permease [Vagococcus salmoninarum]RST96896.1 amino acid ABC transporter permease [Vagococcus salmoninarum]